MRSKHLFHLFCLLYLLVCVGYGIFSFALTDRNLTYLNWQPYWSFQWWMWSTFYDNSQLLTQTYIGVVSALFGVYLLLIKASQDLKEKTPQIFEWGVRNFWGKVQHKVSPHSVENVVLHSAGNIPPHSVGYIAPRLAGNLAQHQTKKKGLRWGFFCFVGSAIFLVLMFSNNALSHDLFNYMFNAKMLAQYYADPHVVSAREVAPRDEWLRFMHNVHTPAPYGYGWTFLSLLPYAAGVGKFLATWIAFKFMSFLSLMFLLWSITYCSKQIRPNISIVEQIALMFNPLLLIEVLSNGHNDLWMLAPAVLALSFLIQAAVAISRVTLVTAKKIPSSAQTGLSLAQSAKQVPTRTTARTFQRKEFWFNLLLSLLFLGFSASIKFATLVLLPFWVVILTFFIVKRKAPRWISWVRPFQIRSFLQRLPLFSSWLLFLPLLTDRAQQFHPWYLTWVLVWLPLITGAAWWKRSVIVLSFSSLLRYSAFFSAGFYNNEVIWQQKLITWIPFLLWLGIEVGWWGYRRLQRS